MRRALAMFRIVAASLLRLMSRAPNPALLGVLPRGRRVAAAGRGPDRVAPARA